MRVSFSKFGKHCLIWKVNVIWYILDSIKIYALELMISKEHKWINIWFIITILALKSFWKNPPSPIQKETDNEIETETEEKTTETDESISQGVMQLWLDFCIVWISIYIFSTMTRSSSPQTFPQQNGRFSHTSSLIIIKNLTGVFVI